MMRLGEVYIDSLVVGERHRALVKDRVGALAESMREIGLQNPIHVWSPDPTEAYLVAGRHRLAAAESLGWMKFHAFSWTWTKSTASYGRLTRT